MAVELDNEKNDKFVQDLLCLSQNDSFGFCNCAGKLQTEELAGWPVLHRCRKGDKVIPPSVNIRSKSKSSKRIGPLTNDITINTKGGGSRKVQEPLLIRPTYSDPLEAETKLLDLKSHEEHANFYTQRYSSTKNATLNACVDQPYELRPGDTRALSLRLRILELLVNTPVAATWKSRSSEILERKNCPFARQLLPWMKPSDASLTYRKTDGATVRLFAHEHSSNDKINTSFVSRANSVLCSPRHGKKHESLNLSRLYQSAPNCRAPRSKRDHMLEISTFRLSKSDLPRNKACKASDRSTIVKGVVGSRMLERTSSSFSDTRSYKAEPPLVHRTENKVVLSYHHN